MTGSRCSGWLGALMLLAAAGCSDDPAAPDAGPEVALPEFARAPVDRQAEAQLSAMLEGMNRALEASGADYRARKVEYITAGNTQGNTVLAKDVGDKRLGEQFVPFDPRRAPWSGPVDGPTDDITYAIDRTGDAVPPIGGLTGAETTAAIQSAMDTWEAVRCSVLPLTENPDFGIDIGVLAAQFGLGGSFFVVADIHHAGWRDIDFTDATLAATVTFIWIDPATGQPTDIDGDGYLDVAFREIYYDPSFPWADDGVTNVDVESVALHEAGHGLSQAHFGKLFIQHTGTLQAAPRAVMNAGYIGPIQTLLGPDLGGHCGMWAQWPNN